MSQFLSQYRELDIQLCLVRWRHAGFESEEEDRLVDEMETLWWKIEESERELLRSEPQRSLIRPSQGVGIHRDLFEEDKQNNPCSPARNLKEVA